MPRHICPGEGRRTTITPSNDHCLRPNSKTVSGAGSFLRAMKYNCPNCKEVIHDPNRKICGICGTPLPRVILASTSQGESSSKDAAEVAGSQKRNAIGGLRS